MSTTPSFTLTTSRSFQHQTFSWRQYSYLSLMVHSWIGPGSQGHIYKYEDYCRLWCIVVQHSVGSHIFDMQAFVILLMYIRSLLFRLM
jgi:hypothetical protein